MRIIGQILLILGLVSVVWVTASRRAAQEVTSKSVRAFDDYFQNLQSASGQTNEAPGEWSSQPELHRLRVRLALAGGHYNGQTELILFGAFGLILMVIGSYFIQRETR